VKKPTILLAALMLASCALPELTPIQTEPKAQRPSVATLAVDTASATPELPAPADDGLRLPDMLGLPDDNQLRSATPLKKEGEATIIASPPVE
jgi:hypothetical protein